MIYEVIMTDDEIRSAEQRSVLCAFLLIELKQKPECLMRFITYSSIFLAVLCAHGFVCFP